MTRRARDEVRVMKQSQHAFDKAMELYEKGFYYEAKNLYARVLRENPGDMAAKYYIFRLRGPAGRRAVKC